MSYSTVKAYSSKLALYDMIPLIIFATDKLTLPFECILVTSKIRNIILKMYLGTLFLLKQCALMRISDYWRSRLKYVLFLQTWSNKFSPSWLNFLSAQLPLISLRFGSTPLQDKSQRHYQCVYRKLVVIFLINIVFVVCKKKILSLQIQNRNYIVQRQVF